MALSLQQSGATAEGSGQIGDRVEAAKNILPWAGYFDDVQRFNY